MTREEIIERLNRIAKHAVHTAGEPPFVMNLDDGIAVHCAIEALSHPEPCEDAVSRQDATEAMCTIVCGENRRECDGLNKCEHLKIFDDLPPVTPKMRTGKWVPVSERLPEKTGAYLVTVKNGNIKIGHFTTLDDTWTDAKATAWQELPEPYREGES